MTHLCNYPCILFTYTKLCFKVFKRKSLPPGSKWTRPMEQPSSDEDLVKGRYWRKIDKIIIHNKFINEARSWKGFDYALLKLSSEHGKGGSPPEGNVMPVCLPLPNFDSRRNDSLFMAGYGRRTIPHCLTDASGPEKYEVCVCPYSCYNDILICYFMYMYIYI